LLARGADPGIRSHEGQTAVEAARNWLLDCHNRGMHAWREDGIREAIALLERAMTGGTAEAPP
jgi:hypothetical protein